MRQTGFGQEYRYFQYVLYPPLCLFDGIGGLRRRLTDIDYSKKEVEMLLGSAEIRPAVHQLEKHPYLPQNAFCKWHEEVSPALPNLFYSQHIVMISYQAGP